MKDLHLKLFKANSFMGISHDSPVVIDFTKAKKNQHVTLLQGDQETGKTSTLYAIMRVMGSVFGFDLKHTVNNEDETVDVEHEFTYEGADYIAKLSGERLSLKRFYKEANKWIPESSPAETLKKIFGNLGLSPMFLKEMEGRKQIEWFKKTFGSDQNSKREEKIIKDLTEAIDQRKNVNKMNLEVKGWLAQNDLFKNYEHNQKRFAEPINVDKEKKAWDELSTKSNNYQNAVHNLTYTKNLVASQDIKIAELERQLAAAKEKKVELQVRVANEEKWIEDNKNVVVEFEKANREWVNLSKTMADQSQWKEVLKKEKELQSGEDLVISVNALIDTLRSDLRELTAAYLPKIKGLEIRIKSMSIDNENEDEGIYYQGKSLAQLSESELSELFLLIWKAKKVCFVFIENISSYGSGFVKVLNDLVKAGDIQVFASEMDRKKKEMEISFTTKID